MSDLNGLLECFLCRYKHRKLFDLHCEVAVYYCYYLA